MQDDYSSSHSNNAPHSNRRSENSSQPTSTKQSPQSPRQWSEIWEGILRMGLGEIALRVGTALASVIFILIVVWVMSSVYLKGQNTDKEAAIAAVDPTPTPTVLPPLPQRPDTSTVTFVSGITRLAQMHTTLPSKARFEITRYEVLAGDTVFGISQRFNLKPQTILWGNYNILADDPHRLLPGQKLVILPVDGAYYQWHAGDKLASVAKYFNVKPETILNWPSNPVKALGDGKDPNNVEIAADSWIIVPGGVREFVTWSAPRITRANPTSAKVLGEGACGKVVGGAVGNGSFVWPTSMKDLSGYDYSPDTNHWGIDIRGALGNPIYAADNGVIVYAGWNDWGYGNMIVIDHGTGWQTLYAHLSAVYVQCGGSVLQGASIGALGSTGRSSGPHLHFELMSPTNYRVNPWDFLRK